MIGSFRQHLGLLLVLHSGIRIFWGQAPVSKYVTEGLAQKGVKTSFDIGLHRRISDQLQKIQKSKTNSTLLTNAVFVSSLSWSIYILGRPQGPVNMPQSQQNPDPVLLRTLYEIYLDQKCVDQKCKYAQSSEDTLCPKICKL